MDIIYKREDHLSTEEFIQILKDSTLAERRPIEDLNRMKLMMQHCNLVITARVDGILVGVARSWSDFSYTTYLADLAVSQNYQSKGIGKELIKLTKLETPLTKLILVSAPKAVEYYPKIGMTKHEACYLISDVNEII
jgi:predicted N-acetyltransferase YhbS